MIRASAKTHCWVGLTTALLALSPQAWAQLTWSGVTHRCTGPDRGEVTARLDGIPWGQSWEDTCAGKVRGQRPPDLNRFGAVGQPSRCDKDAMSTGIWGKWQVSNDPRCATGPRWEGFERAGCFGPNRQVYSARLMNARDWDADCRATDTRGVPGREGWGVPDRCARDALNTGIWGEWITDEACATPLAWGSFRDNGCVRDMAAADANRGGVSVEGKRSYSAVLYNVGGNWSEACRFAPASVTDGAGRSIAEFEHPTACVIADADRVLGYTMAAVAGGLSGLLPPLGAKAAVAAGAVIGIGTTAATEGAQAAISGLNVWGIFWVDDARCGDVPDYVPVAASTELRLPTGQLVQASGPLTAPPPARTSTPVFPAEGVPRCPDDVRKLRGTRQRAICACSSDMTQGGRVWGINPYTDDSRICRAAVHAGVISSSGGLIGYEVVQGSDSWTGSTRHGVTTSPYGAWPGGVRISRP